MVSAQMRVGLIQCGNINSLLVTDHGDYPQMFSTLLGSDLELTVFDVQAGAVPDADECDGWLVSGSVDSTYDDLPWIAPAESLLRDIVRLDVPLVGVCFGHQLLAQALGGRVEKASTGWGIGVHEYRLAREVPATAGLAPGSPLRLIASHQDQVTELPAEATLLASSDHCPVAAYSIGPRVLAIQPHPEFSLSFAGHLIEARRHVFGDDLADSALAGVARSWSEPLDDHTPADRPDLDDGMLDRRAVADWIRRVLTLNA